MKKIMTRLMAGLLLVCMLATYVVPATFAGADSEGVFSYNFAIYDDPITKAVVLKNGTSYRDVGYTDESHHGCKKTAQACIKECFYDAGEIDWYLEGSSDIDSVEIRANTSHQEGTRINATTTGQWVAFRVRISQTGKYAVTFNSFSGGNVAEAYMFPASALTGGKTVDSQMVEANKMNDVVLAAGEKNYDAQLGEIEVAESGEYIIAFRAVAKRLYFNALTLTKTGEVENETSGTTETNTTQQTTESTATQTTSGAPEESKVWDFEFYNNPAYADVVTGGNKNYNANCACGVNHTVYQHMQDAYEDLGWKIVGASDPEFGSVSVRVAEGNGIRFAPEAKQWVGINLKVQDTGRYNIYASGTSNQSNIEMYLFDSALDQSQIAEKMSDLTAISSNRIGSGVSVNTVIGAYDFTAGDYTLVIYNSNGSKSKNIYLKSLSLEEIAQEIPTEATGATTQETEPSETTLPTLPAGKTQWDFCVYDLPGFENVLNPAENEKLNGDCNCGLSHKIKDHLDAAYDALGWKFVGISSNALGEIAFRSAEGRGLSFKIPIAGWVAITVNVSENGVHDITASGRTDHGNMDAYLFEGALSTSQITEKMADLTAVASDLVKKNVKPGEQTETIGRRDFTAGEYTFVFYNTDASRVRTMYISTLGLVKTDEPYVPPVTTQPGDTDCAGTYIDNFYNFALITEEARHPMFNNGNGLADRDYTSKCYACGKTVKDCLAKHWAEGTLNWVMEGTSFAETRIQKTGGVRFRYDADADGNKIPAGQKDGKDVFQESAGNWVAYRVKVATAGTFTVTVNKTFSSGWTGEMYIIPAPAATMTKSEILSAMAEENRVGTVAYTGTMTASKVGDYTFGAAGEYMILIKAASKRMYLDSISLTVPQEAQPIPAAEKKVYDFDLSKDDQTLIKKGPTSRYNADGSIRVYEVLNDLYTSGKTGWNYEQASSTFTASNASFRAGCFRFKSTENFRDLDNQWYAFRIQNPGTATYDIRLTTSADSQMVANIYLIPTPNQVTLSQEKIEAGMCQENLLVKGALFEKKGEYYLGQYPFGMEEEYVLVLEFTKGTILHISDITMTLDGVVADGTVKKDVVYNGFVYDFDMGDSLNGYFSAGKTYMPDVISDLNNMWNSGILKWKYLTSSNGDAPSTTYRFYRQSGMRIYTKTDAWIAFRIKSPGSGTYTLTMNHALASAGGTTAVYILPVGTEDIEKAMDPSNRVGKVIMYNDGAETIVDGSTSFVGYWDFEAGKEYIMVFEAYKESPFSATNSYMNISQVIAERGKIDYTSGEEKVVSPVVVEENIVPVADALGDGLITDLYGHDIYFLPVEGGATLVYDLDTGELYDKIPTGYARTLDMRQDKDGIVWISGSSKYIVRYDPYTKETTKTPAFGKTEWMKNYSGAYTICPTPDGKLWFGTYYSGVLGIYDPETETYRKIGAVYKDNVSQLHGMIYHDGFLYVSIHNDSTVAVVKFDVASEQVVGTLDITDVMGTVKYLNNLSMLGDGDFLVGGINSGKTQAFICIDPETMELYKDHGMFGGMGMCATEIIDGKQYMVCNGYGLYEYDVATKTFSKTPGFGNDGIGFRSSGNSLVTLNGERCLLTWTTSGGHPRYFNLDTQEYKTWDNLVIHGSGGAAIREVATGLEGDTNLYIGVFNSDQGAIFDTAQGKKIGQFRSGGQGDSFIWYEGKFYAGNYSSTTLNEIYLPEDPTVIPAVNEFIQRWRLDHEQTGQKRVHELAAGDGYIFAGTIPDTGCYGGAVTVYDTKTGRWFTHRDVVPGLAVTGLEYSDKLLYGATTTSGGTGTTEAKPEGSSAKLFVYDYENRETLAVLDPRDYIKGLSKSEVTLISSFGKDPVVEGRMWAVVSETLICFTYDRERKTFDVQEVISFDKTTYDTSAGGSLWCKNISFDAERNYIYVSFATNGGFQRIELENMGAETVKVVSNERIMGDKPQFFAIGADGELYYGNDASLKMLPLNVTDEDWAIATAIDKMVTDLGTITLESESAIKNARSAYENLSWRYKALIQNLELLQEVETDLLECKIDTIVLEAVDADTLPQLQEYMDTYNGFNARQRKYVKNYDALMEAYTKATTLNNERVAAAMQKRIDALGEKFPLTLEDEPEVLTIRADFDALSGPQRMLVDAAILEDAEAQIKVLRAEFVKYVESLIQQIPDKITLDADAVITAAREAADKLYTNERKNVSYSKLTSAEGKLRTLKNAKAAAEEVDTLIDAIGIVTLGDKDRIAEAREAYDALNDTALTFLQNGKKLQNAEWMLKALQTWMIPAIIIVDAGVVFAVIWFISSLRSKVFRTQKKEEITKS